MRYETYVKRVAAEIAQVMFLHEWQWTIEFDREMAKGDLADILINDRYLGFTIRLSRELRDTYWNGRQIRQIAETLVHEMAHVLTDPLYMVAVEAVNHHTSDYLEHIREKQTQRITNVVMALLPKKVWALWAKRTDGQGAQHADCRKR